MAHADEPTREPVDAGAQVGWRPSDDDGGCKEGRQESVLMPRDVATGGSIHSPEKASALHCYVVGVQGACR